MISNAAWINVHNNFLTHNKTVHFCNTSCMPDILYNLLKITKLTT